MKQYRDDFPMLSKTMEGNPLIYFDWAATAQKPACVIDAMNDFYTNHYATVHRAIYSLSTHATDLYHQTRVKVQTLLNAASPNEIIFTKGTTESINLFASSYGETFLQAGDEVILTEVEHHANIVPWVRLKEKLGILIRTIPVDDRGELDLDTYQQLLSDRTKIVSVPHVSNTLGTIFPIKTICELAHKKNTIVFVDGAQAAPHLAIDVKESGVDCYAFSGHKLYGPTGIGILYGKESLLKKMPPYLGGGDMIDTVTFDEITYQEPPLKFEAGTPPIAEVIGLGAAIDYLQDIGFDTIEKEEERLTHLLREALIQIPGLHLIGDAQEKAGVFSFLIDGLHPLDIGTLLNLKGVAIRTGHHCSQPAMARFNTEATARASISFLNTQEEITTFYNALSSIVSKLT